MLDAIMLRLFVMFTVNACGWDAVSRAETKAIATVNALAVAATRKYGSEVL